MHHSFALSPSLIHSLIQSYTNSVSACLPVCLYVSMSVCTVSAPALLHCILRLIQGKYSHTIINHTDAEYIYEQHHQIGQHCPITAIARFTFNLI